MNPASSISGRAGAPVGLPIVEDADRRAEMRPLRLLVWLYVVLWLTEGALRKWFLPGLANPLLIVRDPVLMLIYWQAYVRGVFPRSVLVTWIALQGIVALLVSVAATNATVVVELYGLRASYLHLPLIFVIPGVFNGDDVRRVGFWWLACAPPMSVLVFLQFVSRPTAWINAGVGGSTNGQMESALGHIRPAGTFSFTNGLTGFTVLAVVFFLWQLFEKKLFPRLLWLSAGGSLIILVTLSGSRGAVGAVGSVLAAVVIIGFMQPRYWPAVVKLLAIVGLIILVIGSFSVFQQGLGVFSARFGDSKSVQTGFFGRYFESLYRPLLIATVAEPLGVGLGMGTNVASGLANNGKRLFVLAEGDMARVILESGPVIGLTYQLLRTLIVVAIGSRAFSSLFRNANTLPLLIFSGTASSLLTGAFAQPTELGYAVIAAGLCLAANNPRTVPDDPSSEPEDDPQAAVARPTIARGRSAYAERLHGPDTGTPAA